MPCIPIDTAVSGDNTLVAAIPGRKVRVLGYILVGAAAVSVRWKSATTALSGAMLATAPLACQQSGSSFDTVPALETNPGEALVLNLSAAVQVSGHLTFEVV